MGLLPTWLHRTPLGWLQLSHDKGRLLVALAGIAFADVLMFMQLGFQAALYESNTRLNRALQADIVLLSPQARNTQALSTFTRRRLYQAQGCARGGSRLRRFVSQYPHLEKSPNSTRDDRPGTRV